LYSLILDQEYPKQDRQPSYDDWDLHMSSRYIGSQNTKESLLDNEPDKTGAGTQGDGPQYIQVSYRSPMSVQSVELSAPCTMAKGWVYVNTHCNGREIQFLNEKEEWETILTVSGFKANEAKLFKFPRMIIARRFRLFSSSSFVCTGRFKLRPPSSSDQMKNELKRLHDLMNLQPSKAPSIMDKLLSTNLTDTQIVQSYEQALGMQETRLSWKEKLAVWLAPTTWTQLKSYVDVVSGEANSTRELVRKLGGSFRSSVDDIVLDKRTEDSKLAEVIKREDRKKLVQKIIRTMGPLPRGVALLLEGQNNK